MRTNSWLIRERAKERRAEIEKEMENPDLSTARIIELLKETRSIRDGMMNEIEHDRVEDRKRARR